MSCFGVKSAENIKNDIKKAVTPLSCVPSILEVFVNCKYSVALNSLFFLVVENFVAFVWKISFFFLMPVSDFVATW